MDNGLEGDGIHEPSGGYYGSSAHDRWIAAQEGYEIVYDVTQGDITQGGEVAIGVGEADITQGGEVVYGVVEADITQGEGRLDVVFTPYDAPAPAPLAWLERVLPGDELDEQVGDAMETLARMRCEGAGAWRLRLFVVWTILCSLLNALRDRLRRISFVRR